MSEEDISTERKLVRFQQKIGLAESQELNVSRKVTYTCEELEADTEYLFRLDVVGGVNGMSEVGEFKSTYKDEGYFVIPLQFVREHKDELKPGRSIRYTVFEEPDYPELANDQVLLDRVSVISDECSADGCYSALNSPAVVEYLDGNNKPLRFRNTRTMEETVAISHADYANHDRFKFPFRARKQISASKNDLIEIIVPDTSQGPRQQQLTPVENSDKDVEALIREMHSAMMDMYNDYLERQDE